ncbi:unnamed protein product [Notodromas monacha]|uniref:F-BAR domain-containing protein n=1 Tax=Notodromas monacha TaxID=399045 RepID=A0A7R9BGA6_9CRUS|nr:unnamed protein product [Notodromas monacha]CAG0914204.1 unnamed protein product [Notodromas monacha]
MSHAEAIANLFAYASSRPSLLRIDIEVEPICLFRMIHTELREFAFAVLSESTCLSLEERAELEKNYAKSLRSWSKKWEDHFDRGLEYGTTKEALKGTSGEANRLADLHLCVRERILEELCPKMRNWQKDNYHKSMMQLKEKKEMDDRFRKEQKPWEKLYNKVNKARSDYHNARKNERTALNNQLNASRADPTTPDAVSLEYGTTKEALKGTSGEANRLADLHLCVRERILEELCPKMRNWQKDNYHKSMMQLKEKKEMDDRFRKEQKPWEKLYNKVNKARSDYHNARKNERTALNNQLNASRADPTTPDAVS